MKLRVEQLAAQLQRSLAPIYFIFGDEPLLLIESLDAIRHSARQRGYSERESFHVEAGFGWDALHLSLNSGSLFADKRLVELHLGTQKPGDGGGEVLRAYAERPGDDIIFLITAAKLDSTSQRSRWFSALDSAGISVQLWPVTAAQLPGWIATRLRSKGLHASQDAIGLIAAHVEGNLLAAAQEIDKLYLLYGQTTLTVEQVLAAISDNARYSLFDLVDAALAAKAKRSVRIVNGLRGEGVEPVLVLWALAREIRLLHELRYAVDNGQNLAAALQQHKVWEKRKPLLGQASRRLTSNDCRRLLCHCATIDRIIKGVDAGHAWDELMLLSLALAGRHILLRQSA